MPSLFAALEDQLSDAVDTQFAEPFRFMPMTMPTVNSRPTTDATRPVVTLNAVLDERSANPSFARLGAAAQGASSSGGPPHITATTPMLFVESRRMGAAGTPRRHDRFQRVDTGDVYEVTNVELDGQGRLKLGMIKVAKVTP